MSRRILLVRHGAVSSEIDGKCYGQSDVALSEKGLEQTDAVAKSLEGAGVTHLYHSGLRRTRTMAERLSARCGVGPVEDPRLREMHFGEWEMRPWEEIIEKYPEAVATYSTAPESFAAPGGETPMHVRDRVLAWHRDLPESGVVVACTHGGAIAALRGSLGGLPPAEWLGLVPHYGEVVELD
jgi:broad specificity phosphatase PhoE